ncbi:MAG: type II toxin-antitoxin system VapB family antitoxin [Zoogloeaceae bacterium]|nr:type II toxin-antitoxin system VapB family antitoxin [Zoogloeaceae bacterium]
MTMARVFTSGNSQAVRLPRAFRVDCAELTIFRRGKEIVLCEPPRNLARAFELLSELPDDFLSVRGDTVPQKRESL